ncbi:ROK family protein, partial [Aerococcus sanguinicola]|uniref:ROK family protein n=1 Tax=unclassified Aerococcus TaxID=2618060 RepID=UPI0008A46CB7|nr:MULTISPECIES: ROK family protein [unclassified Aerococcus]KAB0645758.1 ROK family protein [Aerococcus sanguinicola]MDK6234330.1 ROK family protein [Aerococcus sp. UMB10185]MDK6856435.1 ROK family protein [Aerococcus sp. UMB7533]OFN01197.1 hypothetical protein HMPREF2626_08015 [Aerococcus sp. HMSC062A02]OHO44339.1 hypothetical protein HMPREF2705_07000 [Aerococcus sp. HMSC035B07]
MYLAFDMGGSAVKYAALDRSGNILYKNKFPSPKDSLDDLIHQMFAIVEELDGKEGLKCRGISMCCPGVVDSYQGIVYWGGNLPYLHQANLKKIFMERFNLPVSVENDGKAGALAELWRGAIHDVRDAVVLVLGSAIGGGIIINNQLHRGAHYSAGEVSYMVGDPTDTPDVYLRQGFDASAPKMIRSIARLNGLAEDTDGQIVFDYIKPENKESWQVFTTYCRKIARMIVSLQYIIDPEKFVICGGISAQVLVRDQIYNEIKQMYEANKEYSMLPVIVQSSLNNDANLYGTLYHFIEEHLEDDYRAILDQK